MSAPESSKIPPANAIRSIGEGDRNPEYKDRRDGFIKSVDNFLADVSAAVESTGKLLDMPVRNTPGEWDEFLGRKSARIHTTVRHTEAPGVYYFTDEKSRPHFQIVEREVMGSEKVVTRVWNVVGADPLERMGFGPEAGYSTRGQTVDLARVSYREDDHETSLVVRGDGSMRLEDHRPGNAYSGKSIQDPNEMFAHELILDELSNQFFGTYVEKGEQ